ncbi:GGDEF domain-containing protein [Erythrobacter sp.]|uniref:GGDEF domain-containing protein n=1 Tax=Erythrobacter sp. TaxID=1042 RepID=UPI002600AF6A|nr:GGDEF domain-containing protein [Erythrobacter sp.]
MGIEVSLEAAMAAWLVALVLGAVIGQKRQRGMQNSAPDPLSGLFARSVLENVIDSANRRIASRAPAQAVLHGRIDQIAALRAGWDFQAREQFLGNVAAVMKASIRSDDNFISAQGDGFTIVMPGADESAAKGVADRLRRALAQAKLPLFGSNNAFTASFGVAAGSASDSSKTLVARAGCA